MSATEFQDLSSQLADSTCLLLVLERIVQVKNGLDNAKEACALKQFKTASENLAKVLYNVCLFTLLQHTMNKL